MSQPANSVTIRNAETNQIIAVVNVGSRSVLWIERKNVSIKTLMDTGLQRWIGYHQELIATPDWHADEPRLANTQAEFLSLRVDVADEYSY